jgi:hypothetical protein
LENVVGEKVGQKGRRGGAREKKKGHGGRFFEGTEHNHNTTNRFA